VTRSRIDSRRNGVRGRDGAGGSVVDTRVRSTPMQLPGNSLMVWLRSPPGKPPISRRPPCEDGFPTWRFLSLARVDALLGTLAALTGELLLRPRTGLRPCRAPYEPLNLFLNSPLLGQSSSLISHLVTFCHLCQMSLDTSVLILTRGPLIQGFREHGVPHET
jgi:hypothetical protein